MKGEFPLKVCSVTAADFERKPHIGAGSARTVYLYGRHVAKVARTKGANSRGHAQNETEFTLYRYVKQHGINLVCPVHDITPDNSVLIMSRAIPLIKLIKEKPGMHAKVQEFRKRLRFAERVLHEEKRGNFSRSVYTKEESRILKSKWFYQIQELIYTFELAPGDLCRQSSWGYYRQKFVLIDYGLTNAVYQNHYYRK